jgi:hypothetical protein
VTYKAAQSLFVILCLITIVCLILLPSIFGHAKVEENLLPETLLTYTKKALAVDPKDEDAFTYKGIALDYLGVVFTQIGNNFVYLHGLHFAASFFVYVSDLINLCRNISDGVRPRILYCGYEIF